MQTVTRYRNVLILLDSSLITLLLDSSLVTYVFLEPKGNNKTQWLQRLRDCIRGRQLGYN